MSELRFCFLTTFYPPYSHGGDAVAVQRLARGLVRAGHHVTVIHDRDAYTAGAGVMRDPPIQAEHDGVEVITLRTRTPTLSALLTQQLGRPVINGRRIEHLLRNGRFDVINYHNVSLVGGPGVLSYGDGLKIYMAHEHWLVCPTHVLWRDNREVCTGKRCVRCQLTYRRPPQLWRMTGLLERQLANVDLFIAMSEFSRDKHREFGFPHEMHVLPPFVPPPSPSASMRATFSASPHPRPYFLFAGRLEAYKGVQDVIPLFAHYRDADLLIAGEGPHGAALRAVAQGIPGVTFLGRVAEADLEAYFRHAVALIVPSRCFETFGVILPEAFRESTPVIARRLGPLPEIVEQAQGGELFTTPAELLAAMTRLQHDAEHRARLAAAARAAFEARYSEDAVVPRYLDIVRAGLAAKTSPARTSRPQPAGAR